MARHPPLAPRRHARIPSERLASAIEALKRRREEILGSIPAKQDDPKALRSQWTSLVDKAQATYRIVFGEETVEAANSRQFHFAYLEPATDVYGRPSWDSAVARFKDAKQQVAASFQTQIELLEERLSEQDSGIVEASASPNLVENALDVFIVHGHDTTAMLEVARILERVGLRPVILHEQPNGGRTIIEKFEQHAGGAGFAIVLLTPDDEGGPPGGPYRPRARQNVIGELFWFAGKLGRSRVCALRKGDVEIPSDFAGLVYTEMDDWGGWKTKLLGELEKAGYTANWRNALS